MESLKVENFLGMNDIELPDLKMVNIILGRNGAGKTALLNHINGRGGLFDSSLPHGPDRLAAVSQGIKLAGMTQARIYLCENICQGLHYTSLQHLWEQRLLGLC